MKQDHQSQSNKSVGGSQMQSSSRDDASQADATPNDEGADPTSDIRKQNPGQKTSADLADELAPDDPHKVEKLTKAGRPDFDPDAGSD